MRRTRHGCARLCRFAHVSLLSNRLEATSISSNLPNDWCWIRSFAHSTQSRDKSNQAGEKKFTGIGKRKHEGQSRKSEYLYGRTPVEAAFSVALGINGLSENQLTAIAKYVRMQANETWRWERREALNRLYLLETKKKIDVEGLEKMAIKLGVPITKDLSREELDRLVGPNNIHQGIALQCSPLPRPRKIGYLDKWERDQERQIKPPLWLVLDEVWDPHVCNSMCPLIESHSLRFPTQELRGHG